MMAPLSALELKSCGLSDRVHYRVEELWPECI